MAERQWKLDKNLGKILFFEGAGWCDADISKATVGNCRIRTAFHLDDGQAVYLELNGMERKNEYPVKIYKWQYTGFVAECYSITDEVPNDDCNKHNLFEKFTDKVEEIIPGYYDHLLQKHLSDTIKTRYIAKTFCYSEEGILGVVNDLGASFDAIKVLPDLAGYRVFPEKKPCQGTEGYYYGDEFAFDPVMLVRREAVYKRVLEIETAEKGNVNFSLWVDEADPGILHLLRHFNGYNKHWTIRTDLGNTLEDWMATAKETILGRYGC